MHPAHREPPTDDHPSPSFRRSTTSLSRFVSHCSAPARARLSVLAWCSPGPMVLRANARNCTATTDYRAASARVQDGSARRAGRRSPPAASDAVVTCDDADRALDLTARRLGSVRRAPSPSTRADFPRLLGSGVEGRGRFAARRSSSALDHPSRPRRLMPRAFLNAELTHVSSSSSRDYIGDGKNAVCVPTLVLAASASARRSAPSSSAS